VSRKRLPLLLCRHNGILVGKDDAVLLEAVALNCRSRADRWTRPWTNSRSACCDSERKGKKREREREKRKKKKKQKNIQETLGGSCDLDDHLLSSILAIPRGFPASSAFSDLSKWNSEWKRRRGRRRKTTRVQEGGERLGNDGRRTRLLRSLIYLIGHLVMTSTFDCSHVPCLLAEQRINFFRESSNSARSLLLRVSEARRSARGVFLQGVSLDTGSRDEGSAAIGSFEEKNTASAISPLVVSHVCRTARSFVFVHFAHPVSEKTLRRLFVTKAQPQITCSRRNSPDVVPVAELFLAGLRARASATNPSAPLLPPVYI